MSQGKNFEMLIDNRKIFTDYKIKTNTKTKKQKSSKNEWMP